MVGGKHVLYCGGDGSNRPDIGLVPRGTRRQLERPRVPLPFGVPGRQQPVGLLLLRRFPRPLPAPRPMSLRSDRRVFREIGKAVRPKGPEARRFQERQEGRKRRLEDAFPSPRRHGGARWTDMRGANRAEGVTAYGLEPRETRRQLEQQREQLPFGEPEQQQPVEQQQHRFPRCLPAPSPTGARLIGPPSRPFPRKRDEKRRGILQLVAQCERCGFPFRFGGKGAKSFKSF